MSPFIDRDVQERVRNSLSDWLVPPPAGEAYIHAPGFSVAAGTTIGVGRKENEDVVAFATFSSATKKSFNLAVIADGIGGMENGKCCAQLATTELISYLAAHESINFDTVVEAIKYIDLQLFSKWRGKGGTTLSVVLITDEWKVAANVGDSRIYAVEQQEIRQLSKDDNIDEDFANFGLSKNIGLNGRALTQFVGMGGDIRPNVRSISDSDNLLGLILSTDGIHTRDDGVFKEIALKAGKNSLSLVQRLLALARWIKTADNGSVLVAYKPEAFSLTKPRSDDHLRVWFPNDSFVIALPVVFTLRFKKGKGSRQKKGSKGLKGSLVIIEDKLTPDIRVEEMGGMKGA